MADTIEHFGVKGMKWGVRKERSVEDVNRSRNIRRAAVVGIGLAGAAILVGVAAKNGRKPQDLDAALRKTGLLGAKKILKDSGSVKASAVRPTGKATISAESQAFLRAFNAKQSQLNKLANADLKAGYDRNQIPIPLRGYLPDW